MTSCCGNELVFNAALSEVVSNNFEFIANLVQNEYSVCVILGAFGLAGAILAAFTFRNCANISITCKK